jgi:hypothetical protein
MGDARASLPDVHSCAGGAQAFRRSEALFAVRHDLQPLVHALLELRGSPNLDEAAILQTESPLRVAVTSTSSSTAMVRLLLKHGARPNDPAVLGLAVRPADVELLLEAGANPVGSCEPQRDLRERQPLGMALERGMVSAHPIVLRARSPLTRRLAVRCCRRSPVSYPRESSARHRESTSRLRIPAGISQRWQCAPSSPSNPLRIAIGLRSLEALELLLLRLPDLCQPETLVSTGHAPPH